MFDHSSTFGEVLDHAEGRAILETFLPGVAASPMATQFRDARLGQVVVLVPGLADEGTRERLWHELQSIGGGTTRRRHLPAVAADPDYEDPSVERGSGTITTPDTVSRWGRVEVLLRGPSHGNPFVDVELDAEFVRPDGSTVRAGGFYDGDGRYLVRLLADAEGLWSVTTRSTARSLDGLTGVFAVTEALAGTHGPVRADGFHFRHADGTRHRPIGTTAYAWTHQPETLQRRTLDALAASPFVKVRMCVFPKSYLYNTEEPADFPFPGSLADGFDLERFDPAHFARLEQRIDDLARNEVQADVILFHPYDRWGFVDLGPAVDDRYTRYVVRRLAAYANVWWSMANEFDLVWSKTPADWERLAAIVREEDPSDHLLSMHNCGAPYDQSRPWITHVSMQRVDVYRTAENTDRWREEWGKPVVVDECGYEGDIDQGWGNLTAEELVRRFWEAAVRGGYLGHGETLLPAEGEPDVLWWSKGGEMRGESPARIRFLDDLIAQAPDGVWDPLPSEWDVPWGGAPGEYLVGYFGASRPRFRSVVLPEGEWAIDVIDTWNMTVDPLPGLHRDVVSVPLPARSYMALRATRR